MAATHPDAVALIAGALAAPADDLPRLVYADYLEEHGDPARAAFIRAQCSHPLWFDSELWHEAVGQLPYPDWYVRACGWLKNDAPSREFGPVRLGDWAWNRETSICIGGAAGSVLGVYRRGSIAEVRMALATFLGGPCETCPNWARHDISQAPAHCPECQGDNSYRTPGLAAALFHAHPLIDRVVLTNTVVRPSGGNYTYYLGGLVSWVGSPVDNLARCGGVG